MVCYTTGDALPAWWDINVVSDTDDPFDGTVYDLIFFGEVARGYVLDRTLWLVEPSEAVMDSLRRFYLSLQDLVG